MNPSVTIREQPGRSQTTLSVIVPYNEGFVSYARRIGGRWRYPYPVPSWQFVVDNDFKEEFRRSLELDLEEYYPEVEDKMSSTIETTRTSNSFTTRATLPYETLPTTPQNGHSSGSSQTETVATAKIAEAVARVVTSQVDRKLQAATENTNLRIASSERLINEALLREKAATDAVTKRLDEVLRPVEIHVHVQDKTEIKPLGVCHKQFKYLYDTATSLEPEDRNIWLWGPAGTGKTSLGGKKLAEALNLPFWFNGPIDSEYKLSGFVDAQGRYVNTQFHQAWTEGGVYLFSECGASLPSALMAFHNALSNSLAPFPMGVLPRHPDLYILADDNTNGLVSAAEYVGRSKMDAAFLDRFVTIEWEYDEALERALAGNDEWVDTVQATRKLLLEKGSSGIVVSMRASIKGAQLLNAGRLTRRQVVSLVFGRYQKHSAWPTLNAHLEAFVRRGDL